MAYMLVVFKTITPNGPAIWGGCVTRRSIRAESWYFSRETVTVQARPTERRQSFGRGGYGALFAVHGTNFIEHYACRGTSLIGATSLSPVTNLVAGTGAVSRYNLSRSQKFVTVQDFNCVQMRALPTSQRAGVRVQQPLQICLECRSKSPPVRPYEYGRAKSVTNNLPILSVLGAGVIIKYQFGNCFG